MEINKENDLIQEAFEIEADEIGFCLDQKWGDYENPYENNDTALAYDLFKKGWKAKATPAWISISERMPNEGEEVFVHHFGHVVQATKDEKYLGGFKQRNCYGWEAVSSYISHWIPTNVELPQSFNFYYENDAKQKAMIEAQEQSHD